MATAKLDVKDLQKLKAASLANLMQSVGQAIQQGTLVQLTGKKPS